MLLFTCLLFYNFLRPDKNHTVQKSTVSIGIPTVVEELLLTVSFKYSFGENILHLWYLQTEVIPKISESKKNPAKYTVHVFFVFFLNGNKTVSLRLATLDTAIIHDIMVYYTAHAKPQDLSELFSSTIIITSIVFTDIIMC